MPPATRTAKTPTRKTPAADILRFCGGEIGGIGVGSKGAGGDAALASDDGACEPGGGGCGGGAGGEDAEPGCPVSEAPPSGRTIGNGGATATPGSLALKKISLSTRRAISAAEAKSSIKPRRRIEFPSSDSTEIGL